MKNFFRSETDDWKIKNTKKNEIIERIIYEKFQTILKKHRKKQVIVNTLSLLLSNVFRIGENSLFLDNEEKRYVFEYWNSYEKMKMTGMLLNFSKSHTKNDFYWYGDVKVFHRTLANVLSEMEKENWCVRRDGYFCFNNGYNKQFEIGYYLFNWPKFYEIYIQYDDLDIQIEDNYSPVVVKRKIDGEYKNVTNEYNIDLLFKDDIDYINKLRNMYNNLIITLDISNANDIQKDILEDYLNQKRYNFEIKDEYTVSIDVKSSILQFYILTYHEDIDNIQDFYSYNSLQNIIDREHIKLFSQCLNYNSSILDAFRAYNGHMLLKQDYNRIITMELFKSIYKNMIEERPYFQGIWLHPEMSKSIILHEASFMKTVSQEMMNKHIPHLCNFDAIYST